MTNLQRQTKWFWTLPFGARAANGNVNSLFFDGRHTYQLSTPDVNGELDWLVLTGVNGLLFPRITTKEAIVREQGVFQQGATAVLLKVPTRNFSINTQIKGSHNRSYKKNLLQLMYILSSDHTTAVQPEGFEEVAEIYDIPDRTSQPNPFTLTELTPWNEAFHIDIIAQTVEPQTPIGNPDGQSMLADIRLTTNDSPFPYSDEIEVALTGQMGTGTLSDDSPPIFFLDDLIPNPIVYSANNFASARTSIRMEIPLGLTTVTPLYSFGIYEVNTGKWARYKYADYPNDGWQLPAGSLRLEFDSERKSFWVKYTSGLENALDLSSSQDSEFDQFQLVPGMTYKFFLELGTSGADPVTVSSVLKYRERFMGMP